MKWKVNIPELSKRMVNRKLVVDCWDGWGYSCKKEWKLEEMHEDAIFELSNDHEYVNDTACIDGLVFDVKIEGSNITGTRKEIKRLIPEKLEDKNG